MGNRVLVVDDEKELANIVSAYLKVEGIEVETANDGEAALALFRNWKPQVVLLDIMLPKLDGIEVCKEIRSQSNASVIMISAKNGEMDKVIALGIGADDYVTKPFSPIELVARVKAQIRRQGIASGTGSGMGTGADAQLKGQEEDSNQVIRDGKLLLNQQSYTALVDGNQVNLTTKEFDMLFFMAKHPNRVYSKEQIYQAVWGYSECCDENSVTVYVNRIRDKLDAYQIDCIKTVWGAGYKYV